jgi:hypothetical protein
VDLDFLASENVSMDQAYKIIYYIKHMDKVAARWVPNLLTILQQQSEECAQNKTLK